MSAFFIIRLLRENCFRNENLFNNLILLYSTSFCCLQEKELLVYRLRCYLHSGYLPAP